ncbi:PREDICTED: putative F-box/kelch-repeat protein At4g11770 [Camelina sativa]|uniref:F-box/kelch-repeat protein At4g11770 n=1 Tax=Camelina sativa TaxID=90675 RepID=A0ABM0TD50_CAMSA|nr:PREDICTED: putative F-box/kelch-repeat protein At4g11770 [Camelina sativa]
MTNHEVYIPDDLLLNCLVRVSRLYYPILSLVSKRFRSIVTSIELYQIRTLLRRTENCLYVRLRFGSESLPRWFALCRRPTRIHTPTTPNPNPNSRWFSSCFSSHRNLTNHARKEVKKSTDEYILFSTPTTKNNSSRCLVTFNPIGPSINMVSSYINGAFMSKVFLFMDSRSNLWYDAPNMTVARKRPIMSVLDGKLYVVEGCKDSDSSNLIEFFDPKTQIWEHVPCPSTEILGRIVSKTLVIDGKLYVFGDKNVVYVPNDNRWYVVALDMFSSLVTHYSSCVIGNVSYIVLSGLLLWYHSVERSWRFVTGLENLPRLRTRREFVRLVDFGGKLAIVWEKKVSGIYLKLAIYLKVTCLLEFISIHI